MTNTELVALINETMAGLSVIAAELSTQAAVPVPTPKPSRKPKKKAKHGKAKKRASKPPKTPEIVKQEPANAEPPMPEPESEESGEWWDDFHQITSKAIEMGVVAVPGQSFDYYKARVFAAAGPGRHMDSASDEMKKLVRKFRVEGINPPAPASTRRQPVQR